MCKQKVVLLKLTGEFLTGDKEAVKSNYIRELCRQIKELQASHYFGIVIGGGNFFRGSRQGEALGMTPNNRDQVGILATLMNGVILQDIFAQEGLDAQLFSALECPAIASSISPQALKFACRTRDCIIFSGGMGSPFFTTDTTAVVRAIQIEAKEIWKMTKVDGVYTQDPHAYPDKAELLPRLTYTQALEKKLHIMDESAFGLARQYRIPIRIFSLFADRSLIRAAHDASFGSLITP